VALVPMGKGKFVSNLFRRSSSLAKISEPKIEIEIEPCIINELHIDVLLQILAFAVEEYQNLENISHVCKRWKAAALDTSMWVEPLGLHNSSISENELLHKLSNYPKIPRTLNLVMCNKLSLYNIIPKFPHIHNLFLYGHNQVNYATIELVSHSCTELRKLDISSMTHYSDITNPLNAMVNLRWLDISEIKASIIYLKLPFLEILHVSGWNPLTIVRIDCQRLQYLNMQNTRGVSIHFWTSLMSNCKELRRLFLWRTGSVRANSLQSFLLNFPLLQELKTSLTIDFQSDLFQFIAASNLKELSAPFHGKVPRNLPFKLNSMMFHGGDGTIQLREK